MSACNTAAAHSANTLTLSTTSSYSSVYYSPSTKSTADVDVTLSEASLMDDCSKQKSSKARGVAPLLPSACQPHFDNTPPNGKDDLQQQNHQPRMADPSDCETSDNPTDDDSRKIVSRVTVKSIPQTGSRRIQHSILQEKWQFMFSQLVAFKERHGHCLVPNRYRDCHALGAWVSTQRRQYKILVSGSSASTPMTPERAAQLESIGKFFLVSAPFVAKIGKQKGLPHGNALEGFVWATTDPRHVPWQSRFDELREFQEKHGHCLIPIGYSKNVPLANWVSTQRQEYKLMIDGRPSRLTEERIRQLSEIGFVWEARRGGPMGPRNKDDDNRPNKKMKPTVGRELPKAASTKACGKRERNLRKASDYMQRARKLMMEPTSTESVRDGSAMSGKSHASAAQPSPNVASSTTPSVNAATAAPSAAFSQAFGSLSNAPTFPLPSFMSRNTNPQSVWPPVPFSLLGLDVLDPLSDSAFLTSQASFLSAVQDAVVIERMRQQAQSVRAEQSRVLALAQYLIEQQNAMTVQQVVADLALQSVPAVPRARASPTAFPSHGGGGRGYLDHATASSRAVRDSDTSIVPDDGVPLPALPAMRVVSEDFSDEYATTIEVVKGKAAK